MVFSFDRFEADDTAPNAFSKKETKYHDKALQAFQRWAGEQFGKTVPIPKTVDMTETCYCTWCR